MKQLIILRGVSGSGKSTIAQKIVENGTINSTDNYFIINGIYEFNASKLGLYHKLNKLKTEQDMNNNISPIIIDNTNLTKKEVKPYVELGLKYSYDIKIIEMEELNLEELLKRQENRKDKKISKEILEKMIKKYKKGMSIKEFTNPY
jgi:NEDD4-binding protein 2